MGTHPARARAKIAWKPLRLRFYSDELRVRTSRVYGYRASCECGYKGPKRRSVEATRADIRAHIASDHRS